MALEPWKVLGSSITYQDRWLKVRSDSCRTPRGTLIDSFHVLEYPNWVNVVAVTPAGEVVLVQEYRHEAGAVLTGLPSGTVEPADAGPEHAMRRELQEETGFTGGTWYQTGRAYANPANQTNTVYSFLALDVRPTGAVQWDESEELLVACEPLAEVAAMAWRGEMLLQAYHVAAISLAVGFLLRSEQPETLWLRQALKRALAIG